MQNPGHFEDNLRSAEQVVAFEYANAMEKQLERLGFSRW